MPFDRPTATRHRARCGSAGTESRPRPRAHELRPAVHRAVRPVVSAPAARAGRGLREPPRAWRLEPIALQPVADRRVRESSRSAICRIGSPPRPAPPASRARSRRGRRARGVWATQAVLVDPVGDGRRRAADLAGDRLDRAACGELSASPSRSMTRTLVRVSDGKGRSGQAVADRVQDALALGRQRADVLRGRRGARRRCGARAAGGRAAAPRARTWPASARARPRGSRARRPGGRAARRRPAGRRPARAGGCAGRRRRGAWPARRTSRRGRSRPAGARPRRAGPGT